MNPFLGVTKGLRGWFAPHPAASEGPQQVLNVTRGTMLAAQLENAQTGAARRKGLLGRERFLPGEGLWIAPCESVHTFFMRFPIDLVYLDRKHRVKKVRSNVAPWRMSACFTAHSVLELPAGTIVATRTERGDSVEFAPTITEAESPA
ncbi:MAG: DUF192 domain-containing protein [Terracidiphilus sp.]|jgi:uncharacterized membrane protein (UPF0127 family)